MAYETKTRSPTLEPIYSKIKRVCLYDPNVPDYYITSKYGTCISGDFETISYYTGYAPKCSPGCIHLKRHYIPASCCGMPDPYVTYFYNKPWWMYVNLSREPNFGWTTYCSISGHDAYLHKVSQVSLDRAHYDALAYFRNGCLDKQLDGSVTFSESPGWGDYVKSMTDTKTSLLKKVAGSRLFYAFGLKPLAADLLGIYKAICEVPTKIQRLREIAGQPTWCHFRTKLDPMYSGQVFSGSNTQMNLYKYRAKYHAAALVTYDISDESLQGASLEWEVWKRELGLINPLTFLWEKIPFSFVLDWFTGVGSFFARLGDYELFRNVQISESYYSISIEESARFDTTLVHGYVKSKRLWGYVDAESYYRYSPLPNVSILNTLGWETPGASSIMNALALAVQLKKDTSKKN